MLYWSWYVIQSTALENAYSMTNNKKPSFLLLVDVEMTLHVEMFSIGISGKGREFLQKF